MFAQQACWQGLQLRGHGRGEIGPCTHTVAVGASSLRQQEQNQQQSSWCALRPSSCCCLLLLRQTTAPINQQVTKKSTKVASKPAKGATVSVTKKTGPRVLKSIAKEVAGYRPDLKVCVCWLGACVGVVL